jgi:hypothetical protein
MLRSKSGLSARCILKGGSVVKIYAIILGAVLTIIGIQGIMVGPPHYTASHNALHLLSGLAGLTLGFVKGGKYARAFAQGFGLVYTLTALLGFAHIPAVVSMLNLNTGGNVIHLAAGLLSFAVGFGVKQKPAASKQMA